MLAAFWGSMLIVFLAELGDKTQLVALCMATRYNAKVVLAGILVATLLVHIISVVLGKAAAGFLPVQWIAFLAGFAFIIFGLWTLHGDCLDDDKECKPRYNSPFMIVAITFFLAELGDKTMLSTVALAGANPLFPIPVWLGSSLGMVISDGLAILVGQAMGQKLPERAVKIGAAMIFFGFGVYKLVTGAAGIPTLAWVVGATLIILITLIFSGLLKLGGKEQVEPSAVE